MDASEFILDVRNLSYRYPRTSAPVLNGITFSVSEGQFVGIVGPTGAGKTTLCLAMCGLIPHILGGHVDGQLLLAGRDTARTPLDSLLFLKDQHKALAGITFQDPEAQLVGMSVEEDLAFGPQNLGLPAEEINRRVDEVLQLLGMPSFRQAFPYSLSGGQKQRVAIGSTLALQPRLLILDEPTSELDPIGRNDVFTLIRQLKEEARLTIVVVEHHTEELARFADRILVLHEGQLVLDGPSAEVFRAAETLRRVGVRPPEALELIQHLQAAGLIPAYTGALSEEAMVAYLEQHLNCKATV